MLLRPQERNGGGDEVVALHFGGEMPAGDEFQSGSGAHHMPFLVQVSRLGSENSIDRLDRSGHHPADGRPRSLGVKMLPPFVKCNTPRVGNGQLCKLQLMTVRIIAKKAAIGGTYRAIRCFDVAEQEHTGTHVDGARRVCRIGMMRMMGVVVIKTAQQYLFFVGLSVAVGVLKQDEICSL